MFARRLSLLTAVTMRKVVNLQLDRKFLLVPP